MVGAAATRSVPLLTASLTILLDGIQGKENVAFDIFTCWSEPGASKAVVTFTSCKSVNRATTSVWKEVDSAQHRDIRRLICLEGAKLGFRPVFVYVSTGDDLLVRTNIAGYKDDIIVVSEAKLAAFLPEFNRRPLLATGRMAP